MEYDEIEIEVEVSDFVLAYQAAIATALRLKEEEVLDDEEVLA